MRCFALIGKRVDFSPSPSMMNAAFSTLHIEALYKALSVEEEEFESKIPEILAKNEGLNVTMPYKSTIIPYLQSLDKDASRIGGVNTVKVNGTTRGFNTDVQGIMMPLERIGIAVKRAALIGTGGAARAFCLAMERFGCSEVAIWDRNPIKKLLFLAEMRKIFPSINFSFIEPSNRMKFDLLFNATPMGSQGIALHKDVAKIAEMTETIFDAVYFPADTELAKIGRETGCRVIRGDEMLLHQGAEAFRIWLNMEPPIKVMEEAIKKFISEKVSEVEIKR